MTFSPEGGVTKVPPPAVRPNACAIVGETTKSRRLVGGLDRDGGPVPPCPDGGAGHGPSLAFRY